jgi:hypothetical protein
MSVYFFQWNRAVFMSDEHSFTSQALEPFHDVVRIRHASAQ